MFLLFLVEDPHGLISWIFRESQVVSQTVIYLFNQWNYLVILTIFVTILEKKTKNYVGQNEWAAGHKSGLFCEGRVRVLIQSH